MKLYDVGLAIFGVWLLVMSIFAFGSEGCTVKNLETPDGYKVEELTIEQS